MGIKGLIKLIKKYSKNGVKQAKLSDYHNGVLFVDTSIYMYAYTHKYKNPMIGFVNQILSLTSHQITPIYVFDGAPPKEKKELLQQRSITKQQQNDKIESLKKEYDNLNKLYTNVENNVENNIKYISSSSDDIRNFSTTAKIIEEIEGKMIDIKNEIKNKSKNIININKTNFEDCKQLFNVFGIPWIIANGEAENICSQLCFYKLNINTDYSVLGCLSNDSDVLVNGGRKLLTNFSSYTNTIVEYDLEIILRDMNLSYEQFVDMSILCGCDYLFDSQNNKHIKIENIGPINAYKLILKDKNIDTIIDKIKQSNSPEFSSLSRKEKTELKKYKKFKLPISNTTKTINTNNTTEYTEDNTEDNIDINNLFDYEKARQLFLEQMSITVVEDIINNNQIKKIDNTSDILSYIKMYYKPTKNIESKILNNYSQYQDNILNKTLYYDSNKSKKSKKSLSTSIKSIEKQKGQKKITCYFKI